jgi:hypothetical protein
MKKIALALMLGLVGTVSAQNIMSLYNMKHIPQAVYANPAFTPLGRVNVSIPTLGSSYAQAGKSNFNTKDVANVDDNGTLRLDVDKFVNGLDDENSMYAATTVEAIHIGFSVNKNYFFMAINDRLSGEFVFPREMAVFVSEVYEEQGIDNGFSIQNSKLQYSHIREYSFGWSRSINKKLSVGLRGKLLSGISNIRTNSSGIIVDNPSSITDISGLIDINMQTSGLTYYNQDFAQDPFSIFPGYSNYGYALDLGFEYRINKKMKVAASVIDLLGTISWNDNVLNYVAEDVRVDFNTVKWTDIINPNGSNAFAGIYDSIVANIDPSQTEMAYETITPTRVLASYSYYLTPKIEATLITQGVFSKNEFEPKIRIGIQGRVKRFLNYMISYAIVDSQEEANNLGIGFALNLGPLQIHALTDNIFDPFLYNSSFNPSLRVGLNLTMNRDYQ